MSTGNLLRQHVEQKSQLGTIAKTLMDKGEMVPDDLVNEVLAEEMKKLPANTSVLFDGYPRTVHQAVQLQEIAPIGLVIVLHVPHEVIVQRMSNRLIHAGSGRTYSLDYNPPKVAGIDDETGDPLVQREDDKPATVQRRLNTYENMCQPIIEHYRSSGTKVEVFKGTESNKIYKLIFPFLAGILRDNR